MRDRIKIICTGEGRHPKHEIALLMWQPELSSNAANVWDALGDQSAFPIHVIAQSVRATKKGTNHVKVREPVTILIRADGGKTFAFTCRACSARESRKLRDDYLSRILRDTPTMEIDIRPIN
jgi:hypothetical protein